MRTIAATWLAGMIVGLLVALGVIVALGRDGDRDGDDPRARDAPGAAGGPETSTTQVDRGGDVLIFLTRDVTDAQRQSIEDALEGHPAVAAYEHWDREESVAEARRLFEDHPEMIERIDANPAIVPASYRFTLTGTGRASADEVAAVFRTWAGVQEVRIAAGWTPGTEPVNARAEGLPAGRLPAR